MTRMHNPPHPGATLRENVLPALGLSVTEAARQLGVTRAALSRVLNERAAISPAMALRLEGWYPHLFHAIRINAALAVCRSNRSGSKSSPAHSRNSLTSGPFGSFFRSSRKSW